MPIGKFKINKEGNKIGPYKKQPKYEDRYKEIKDDIEGGIGCWLEGNLEIDKVSGNFHISFHNYMNEYKQLVLKDHETFLKLNLGYEIIELLFGR